MKRLSSKELREKKLLLREKGAQLNVRTRGNLLCREKKEKEQRKALETEGSAK